MYCDYYNEQGQYSWHYEACGELLTCGNKNYVNHKLEGKGASQPHPVDAMDVHAVEMLVCLFLLKVATLDVQRKRHTLMKILVNVPLLETVPVILMTPSFILDLWCWLTLLGGKLSHHKFCFQGCLFFLNSISFPLILSLSAVVRMGQLCVVSMNLVHVLRDFRCCTCLLTYS